MFGPQVRDKDGVAATVCFVSIFIVHFFSIWVATDAFWRAYCCPASSRRNYRGSFIKTLPKVWMPQKYQIYIQLIYLPPDTATSRYLSFHRSLWARNCSFTSIQNVTIYRRTTATSFALTPRSPTKSLPDYASITRTPYVYLFKFRFIDGSNALLVVIGSGIPQNTGWPRHQ